VATPVATASGAGGVTIGVVGLVIESQHPILPMVCNRRFCQVIEAETLIRQTGAPPRSLAELVTRIGMAEADAAARVVPTEGPLPPADPPAAAPTRAPASPF
jgi:hypothetical protein